MSDNTSLKLSLIADERAPENLIGLTLTPICTKTVFCVSCSIYRLTRGEHDFPYITVTPSIARIRGTKLMSNIFVWGILGHAIDSRIIDTISSTSSTTCSLYSNKEPALLISVLIAFIISLMGDSWVQYFF